MALSHTYGKGEREKRKKTALASPLPSFLEQRLLPRHEAVPAQGTLPPLDAAQVSLAFAFFRRASTAL